MKSVPATIWLLVNCCLLLYSYSAAAAEKIDYIKQIKPLLTEKCYSCHGTLKQESELRLETRSLLLKGGASGAAIVPGNANQSLLLKRITADADERMPPAEEGSALKSQEIDLLRRWINQGAVAPVEEIPAKPQDHWAYQRIEKPAGVRSIDEILNRNRSSLGIKPQPAAVRSILLRRLYLDLIGLPPTHKQLQDQRPWNEIVDELLASPQHGERWGRHWMDIWRYSDWYGLGAQLRNSQKHLWHWRDWIIESLNEDKGYDRMILEMLAGDELAPEKLEVVRGTGFLARNYYLFNRTTWLDSTIEHTSKAFLGITMNCAKCHDHKYDPITQKDYYRLRAIFEPHQVRLDPLPGEIDLEKDGLPRVFDDHLDIKTFLHLKGNPKDPDKALVITPGVPAVLARNSPEFKPVTLPVNAYAPGLREHVQRDHMAAVEQEISKAKQALAKAKAIQVKSDRQINSPQKKEDLAFKITDNFDQPNSKVWELIGNGWKYENGKLQQTMATREKQRVRLKTAHPQNFELTCRYTTTGGTTYKSVTFRFDESQDGSYNNFVYTSAHAPGPKVQIAFTRNGNTTYPPAARAPKPIKVGQSYELKFAVRDRLINVWLDKELVLVYTLPERKPGGFISLAGFDATVAFDSISITSLSDDVQLAKSPGAKSQSPSDPAYNLQIAEATLKTKLARRDSLKAIFAAERAKYQQKADQPTRKQLALNAAELEAMALKAEANLELLINKNQDKKLKAAQSKLSQAKKKLEAVKQGNAKYSPIRTSRKALETPRHKETDYPVVYPTQSTGRRLALAKWIASRDNPLTARVAVNHVWMRHFGQPLVESVFDFGLRTKKPIHADLLDFLAAEFMDSGWSFRHLHRLIVNSQAYQLQSTTRNADKAALATDPNNHYYWRMNARRMESQIIRDSLIHLAGKLDLTMTGPSVDPNQKNSTRRSLYFKHSRDHQDKFLSMYDDADHLQCYRRIDSIVPQQALALNNSQLAIQMAEQIAVKLNEDHKQPELKLFIPIAFELILGRKASQQEQQECMKFCNELEAYYQKQNRSKPEQRIRARLVQALLNHNDFIVIR